MGGKVVGGGGRQGRGGFRVRRQRSHFLVVVVCVWGGGAEGKAGQRAGHSAEEVGGHNEEEVGGTVRKKKGAVKAAMC